MILALDIGGANTKFALIENHEVIRRGSFYFPFWKHKGKFNDFLSDLVNQKNFAKQNFNSQYSLYCDEKIGDKIISELSAAGVTMTAELSDAFRSKEEGVNFILNCVEDVFSSLNVPVYVLSNNGNLISIDAARKNPYGIASANWIATSWYAAKKYKNCILADTGSTTTDIIPIREGKIAEAGKTDLERLQTGELIYTGVLRTNIAAVVNSVPVRNNTTLVSSELFAATADVYLILNEISEEDYSCETSDGRGKSRMECMARLSRVVCADLHYELSEDEVVEIAKYIREKQIEQIIECIGKVMKCDKGNKTETLVAVGLGSFLVKEIAGRLNISLIESDLNPAGALGLMVEEKITDNF